MDDLWKILTSRPGLPSVLKSISEDVLSKVVSNKISNIGDLGTSINRELQDKFAPERQGLTFQIKYLPDSAFELLDDLIERGLDPAQVRPNTILVKLDYRIGLSRSGTFFNVWKKSTVEGLVSRGLLEDCSSIPCADDNICEKRYW